MGRTLGLAIVVALAVGCGTATRAAVPHSHRTETPRTVAVYSTSARALGACRGGVGVLLDAYDTTAGALSGWQDRLLPGGHGSGAQDWASYPAGMWAALCFYGPPAGDECYAVPDATPGHCEDRRAVGVGANGVHVEMTLGEHATWPPADPPIPR